MERAAKRITSSSTDVCIEQVGSYAGISSHLEYGEGLV